MYYLELGFQVEGFASSPREQHLEDLMAALDVEPGVTDADVSAELATGKVTISMYVDAEDDASAFGQALVAARSAIHSAGGFTGGWLSETSRGGLTVADAYDVRVQPAELIDC